MNDTYKTANGASFGDLFLGDKDLHDTTLKGRDGVEVTVNRYILASRSPVFKAMLLGKFSEASGKVVTIEEYDGSVLQAVVEYIHTEEPQILNVKESNSTDQLQILNEKKPKAPDDDGPYLERAQIQTLLSLVAAANYFDLPGLAEEVIELLSRLFEEARCCPLAFLQACMQKGPSVPKQVLEMAWSQVRSYSKSVENADAAVGGLGQETLHKILKDDQMQMSEYQLFTLLLTWMEASPGNRKPIAKDLVHNINLDGINPVQLSSKVKSSGLVTSDQLLQAYEKQALAVANKHSFDRQRQKPPAPMFWSNTSSLVCTRTTDGEHWGLLDCDPIVSGVHQWTLKAVGSGSSPELMFGVASKGVSLNQKGWLTQQKGAWGFQRNGVAYSEGAKILTHSWELERGEQVTLSLDLRPGHGTLSGRIQKKGGNSVAIEPISKLLDHLAVKTAGIVPAVEVGRGSAGGGFQLIDFKKVQ